MSTKKGPYRININNLFLDEYNPRLYGESVNMSQEEIIKNIYEKEDIDELASSLATNGYFDEEPLIIIPKNADDFDKINETNIDSYEYTVVEGNRRTSSIKLLLSKDRSYVDDRFPSIKSKNIEDNLNNIPAIIYKNREDVDVYLSIRHISGNRKWDAYAKAKYIYEKIEKLVSEKSIKTADAINILSSQIGDQSDLIQKNYIYYKIFLTIEKDVIDYSSKEIKERFSLIQVSLAGGNTTIAKYIGIKPFRNINLDGNDEIIEPKFIDNLKDITEWIFGKDEKGRGSLISDSRNINTFLKPILGNEEATKHLKDFDDIEGALALTDGEERLVIGNVKKANNLLERVIAKIPNYKDKEELITALDNLKQTITNIDKILQ